VVVPEPNRRFGGDLTTVWTKEEGWIAVVPTIDCGCRSVLGLTVDKDQHGPAVLASIEEALRQAFVEPKYVPGGVELRTDHGPQYTGADCAALVEKWGLVHTFAPVGRPTGNAVAERVIRTMKEEVIWLRDWKNAAELREALLAWVVRYNTRRPHQALGWKTPAEYRAEKLGLAAENAA
jgi:putative transposase